MKLIFHYIRKHLGSFIAAMIFLCIEATADLLQPTFMGYIVDNGVKVPTLVKLCIMGYYAWHCSCRRLQRRYA